MAFIFSGKLGARSSLRGTWVTHTRFEEHEKTLNRYSREWGKGKEEEKEWRKRGREIE